MPDLPTEIMDYIVSLLHDEQDALKQCCLVSKSWIPGARKHLFNNISFKSLSQFEGWRRTFSDPENSPACHTNSLHAICAEVAEDKALIQSFINVTQLTIDIKQDWRNSQLEAFHNLSPAIESLYLIFETAPLPKIFTLICSFPFLKILCITGDGFINDIDEGVATPQPLALAMFIGTRLVLNCGLKDIISCFLSLPNAPQLQGIKWDAPLLDTQPELPWMMALMERCSDTLEWIDINFMPGRSPYAPDFAPTTPIDFSKAKSLKQVTVPVDECYILWTIESLKTIKPENQDFKLIVICFPSDICKPWGSVGEEYYQKFKGLDKVLTQLWKLQKICTVVKHLKEGVLDIKYLLPGIVEGGGLNSGSQSTFST